jgi:dolichol-phosphate mannosyltransferase
MTPAGDTIVVIPAYNEEKSIGRLIELTLPWADVCVVNDASRDRTEEIVRSYPDVVCITHKKNTHIPQSVLDGMRYAAGKPYRYVITMDAGLSHDPGELGRFLQAPEADVVIGRREVRHHVPVYRRLFSLAASLLFNLAFSSWRWGVPPSHFKDVSSGFRRYSRCAVKLLLSRTFKAKSFDFQVEALMFAYRNRLRILEIPISYKFTTTSLRASVVIDELKMLGDMLLRQRR